MKSSTVQTPQKAAIRRSREKSQKIVAKCLNQAFSAVSEPDLIDSSSISATEEGNQESYLYKIGPVLPFPSPPGSSDPVDLSESFPTPPLLTDGTLGFKADSVEVKVAVDLLLGARRQVLDSPDVDPRSKKLVEYLIKSAIEPLDRVPEEQDGYYDHFRAKVWVGLLLLLIWIVSVSVVMVRDARAGMGFAGAPPPT